MSAELYARQIKKLGDIDITNVRLVQDKINKLHTNLSSRLIIYNAIYHKYKIDLYNSIRKELVRDIANQKLDNTLKEDEPWLSYEELIAIPEKLKENIINRYGALFITDTSRAYIKLLNNYMIAYLTLKYPLRLELMSLVLTRSKNTKSLKTKSTNYLQILQGSMRIILNSFKNVSSMGKQVIPIDKETRGLIQSYLQINTSNYLIVSNAYFEPFKTRVAFSKRIHTIFGINMNTIRKVLESHIIQSPAYSKLSNKQKQEIHAKLLHQTSTAHTSYNKIS